MKVLPVKGKKAIKVITATHRYWKGGPIPSIGLNTNHAGKVELPRKMWKVYLERIKKYCLMPLQKVRVIKEVIRSKILYQLRSYKRQGNSTESQGLKSKKSCICRVGPRLTRSILKKG